MCVWGVHWSEDSRVPSLYDSLSKAKAAVEREYADDYPVMVKELADGLRSDPPTPPTEIRWERVETEEHPLYQPHWIYAGYAVFEMEVQ